MRALVQLAIEVACRYWDLGSIPRSPQTLNNFGLKVFQYSASSKVHHARSCWCLPNVHEIQSEGYQKTSTMYLSPWMSIQTGKVNVARFLVGLNSLHKPPLGARHPHGLHIFILYFNFPFYSFICFIVLFNSQNNFHNTKKSEIKKIKYVYLIFNALIFFVNKFNNQLSKIRLKF